MLFRVTCSGVPKISESRTKIAPWKNMTPLGAWPYAPRPYPRPGIRPAEARGCIEGIERLKFLTFAKRAPRYRAPCRICTPRPPSARDRCLRCPKAINTKFEITFGRTFAIFSLPVSTKPLRFSRIAWSLHILKWRISQNENFKDPHAKAAPLRNEKGVISQSFWYL